MWIYEQKTGNIYHDNLLVSTGYSGNGSGLNNPSEQGVPFVGPIPQGTWSIGVPYNDERKGPYVLPLSTYNGTDTLGRAGFLIHGDNHKNNYSASEGCIILGPSVRHQIYNSGDLILIVVSVLLP